MFTQTTEKCGLMTSYNQKIHPQIIHFNPSPIFQKLHMLAHHC